MSGYVVRHQDLFLGSNPVRAVASGLAPKSVDVVIPAYEEAPGVTRDVERAVAQSRLGHPIVIEGVPDKGTALARGLELVTTAQVAFLDADLLGLRSDHVDCLLSQDPDAMTIGLISGPSLISGERVMPTWLARATPLEGAGYAAEGRLFRAAIRHGVPIRYVPLGGIHHRTTAEKRRPLSLHARRLGGIVRGFSGL